MLKQVALFFSTLAGTHKHDDITHQEVEKLKRSLKDTNTIIAQQLETIAGLKEVNASQVESIQERIAEKEHLVKQLEESVKDVDNAHAEITSLKDRLRNAQNESTATSQLQKHNTELEAKGAELEEDNELALVMLDKFSKELQKT